jgi:hypothetical protein
MSRQYVWILSSVIIKQDEHEKHNTSWHISQYEFGMRGAPHLTQIVEPMAKYVLKDLLCLETEEN